jgi:hypothetical protein
MRVRRSPEVIDRSPRAIRRREGTAKCASKGADLNDFKRWLKTSVSWSGVRAELHAQIAAYGPDKLSEMVDIARAEELTCMRKLQDGNLRMQDMRRQSDTANRSRPSAPDAQTIAWSEEASSWGEKIFWLQNVRESLKRARERHEAVCPEASGAAMHGELMPPMPTGAEQAGFARREPDLDQTRYRSGGGD